MIYKLVAIDLDDTLLKGDLTISERAKKAISQCMAQGTLVTFATGRMFSSALPYALDLKLDLPLITYQGALVKYADGREVYHRPLELPLAQEILRFLKPKGIHINVYINDQLYMEELTEQGRKYKAIAKVPIFFINLPGDIKEDPSKIVLIGESEELDQVQKELDSRYSSQINTTKSKPFFLEISHPLATKGIALKELAQSLDIKQEEVIAIGDNLNDLDMIAYAGCGVAVGNAVAELKAIANFITANNEDDGVAEAIEKLVLRK